MYYARALHMDLVLRITSDTFVLVYIRPPHGSDSFRQLWLFILMDPYGLDNYGSYGPDSPGPRGPDFCWPLWFGQFSKSIGHYGLDNPRHVCTSALRSNLGSTARSVQRRVETFAHNPDDPSHDFSLQPVWSRVGHGKFRSATIGSHDLIETPFVWQSQFFKTWQR